MNIANMFERARAQPGCLGAESARNADGTVAYFLSADPRSIARPPAAAYRLRVLHRT